MIIVPFLLAIFATIYFGVWSVFVFYVLKSNWYSLRRNVAGIQGFNPLHWHFVRFNAKNDPEAIQLKAQVHKWWKLCMLCWLAMVVLMLLLGLVASFLSQATSPVTGNVQRTPATSTRSTT